MVFTVQNKSESVKAVTNTFQTASHISSTFLRPWITSYVSFPWQFTLMLLCIICRFIQWVSDVALCQLVSTLCPCSHAQKDHRYPKAELNFSEFNTICIIWSMFASMGHREIALDIATGLYKPYKVKKKGVYEACCRCSPHKFCRHLDDMPARPQGILLHPPLKLI